MIFNKTTDSACYRCDEVRIWNRWILAIIFENRNILVWILVEFAFAVFFSDLMSSCTTNQETQKDADFTLPDDFIT